MFPNPKTHTFKQPKIELTKTQLWLYKTVGNNLNKKANYGLLQARE